MRLLRRLRSAAADVAVGLYKLCREHEFSIYNDDDDRRSATDKSNEAARQP